MMRLSYWMWFALLTAVFFVGYLARGSAFPGALIASVLFALPIALGIRYAGRKE